MKAVVFHFPFTLLWEAQSASVLVKQRVNYSQRTSIISFNPNECCVYVFVCVSVYMCVYCMYAVFWDVCCMPGHVCYLVGAEVAHTVLLGAERRKL